MCRGGAGVVPRASFPLGLARYSNSFSPPFGSSHLLFFISLPFIFVSVSPLSPPLFLPFLSHLYPSFFPFLFSRFILFSCFPPLLFVFMFFSFLILCIPPFLYLSPHSLFASSFLLSAFPLSPSFSFPLLPFPPSSNPYPSLPPYF